MPEQPARARTGRGLALVCRRCGAAALAALLMVGPAAAAGGGHPPAADRIAWANRLTWGATPAALGKDAPGPGRWLDDQLRSDDTTLPPAAAALVAGMRITREPMAQILVEQMAQGRDAKALPDAEARRAASVAVDRSMNDLANEARERSLLRDLYAPDQLREQMTWFWVNHFSVRGGYHDIRAMIGDYEQTLHDHAFGRFRDLLELTLRHPAMLRYLNNDQNVARHVNENYAREIMELHSMGVGSGYTQQDVQELARILTGVGVDLNPQPPKLKPEWQPLYVRAGVFEFNPARHDFGDKHFLGHTIRGSGFGEVEQALDLIAAAPATAHHVSQQLATFFIGDAPPPALVDRMAATFQRSHGDMAQVMRTLLRSPEAAASLGRAFKDPVHYVVSAMRLTGGERVVTNPMALVNWTKTMGEGLYDHETPDGYPLASAAWSGPGQMATRFDIARQIGEGAVAAFRPAAATTPPAAVPPPPAPPPALQDRL